MKLKLNMEATLAFRVETGYIQTGYEELKQLGFHRWVDGVCVWLFPIENIGKVSAIFGKPIEFNKDMDICVVLNRMPLRRKTINALISKGKGTMEVEELPEVYVITEYRRTEKGGVKKLRHQLPKENVRAMQDVLEVWKKQKILPRDLAERVCDNLSVSDRFRRESGSFCWEKFQGNRRDYYLYYYLPLKVLDTLEFVTHHRHGEVTILQKTLRKEVEAIAK